MLARSPVSRVMTALIVMISLVGIAPARADGGAPNLALVDDGTWLQLGTPSRGGHSVVFDPTRNRLLLFGGTDPILRNDLWWMPPDGSSGWTPLLTAPGGPSRRQHHTAIFDQLRDRMLVFGGDSSSARFNDVWALTFSGLPAWQKLTPLGTPPTPRSRHASVYDPVRDRLLVFGGNDGAPRQDVWELTLSGTPAWNQLAPSGTAPAARYFHSMIYDPIRDRAVVYGGLFDDFENPFNDVWELTLSGTPAWSSIVPVGPASEMRAAHGAIYDPIHDGMVVFDDYNNQELLFAVPTWVSISTPPGMYLGDGEFGVVPDAVGQRMIVAGGRIDLIRRTGETWALDLVGLAWSRLDPEVPRRRQGHSVVYDPTHRQMILYGGLGDYDNDPPADAWILRLGEARAWERITGSSPPTDQRFFHSAIVAPTRNSMIVFGGNGAPATSDVWELDLGGTFAWSQMAASGTAPPARSFHTAVYDAARDRMIVFGGSGTGVGNQVWALTLSGTPTWSQLNPTGTPPSARSSHAAIYDASADRMVVFGGRVSPSAVTNEAWQLSFSPSPAWSLVTPSGTAPQARENAVAALDPARNSMLVFGDQANHSDVWTLSLGGAPAWTKLVPSSPGPLGRWRSAGAFDVEGDRFVVFGGWRANGVDDPWFLSDTWALAFGGPVAVPPPAIVTRARLDPATPNPARNSSAIGFALPVASRASLAVYDAAGRRRRTLRAGLLPAGRHEARWDLADDRGVRVAPGLYFYELRTAGERLTRKAIVIE